MLLTILATSIAKQPYLNKEIKSMGYLLAKKRTCPYCRFKLDKEPTRKKRCPKCMGNMYVRYNYLKSNRGDTFLFTEEGAKQYDLKKNIYLKSRRELLFPKQVKIAQKHRDEFGIKPQQTQVNEVEYANKNRSMGNVFSARCCKCGCNRVHSKLAEFGNTEWICETCKKSMECGIDPAAYPSVVKCKVCHKEVSPSALTCPHCGEGLPGLSIRCPECGSPHISLEKKGFGIGKALVGGALVGPAGFIGGMFGYKDREVVCIRCRCKLKLK